MSIYVDIEKRFGTFFLKTKFETGNETLALLGASGCGKSLTLKCIAGIEKPDKGKIVVDGITLFDSEKGINLSPQERRTGLMFQNYALFPNMTVLQNIQAGAKREKNRQKRMEAIRFMIDSFGLNEYAGHYPHQLSGGQQQRVALARILVSNPRIMLLDEPFSALDSHLRFRLEQEVRQVIREFGKTVILVSHDRDEVFRMSDRIAVMDTGSIQTIGTKKEVFAAPCTRKSAILTGCKNISSIEYRSNRSVFAKDWGITLTVPYLPDGITAVGIRMHEVVSAGDQRMPVSGGTANGAHDKLPVLDAGSSIHSADQNIFHCIVREEIENPFSYTIFLQPTTDSAFCADEMASCSQKNLTQTEYTETVPVGWELDKKTWQQMRSREVWVQFPPESILLLRD